MSAKNAFLARGHRIKYLMVFLSQSEGLDGHLVLSRSISQSERAGG